MLSSLRRLFLVPTRRAAWCAFSISIGCGGGAVLAEVDLDYKNHQCLGELQIILGGVELGDLGETFCQGVFPGVEISLMDFFQVGDRRYQQGGGTRLLSFRHPFQRRHETNRLRLILAPRTNSLWDLHFEDPLSGDGIVTRDGAFSYVIWGKDQANIQADLGSIALPFDDNSMRVFQCNLPLDRGCNTIYNVPTCESYMYPLVTDRDPELPPLRALPIIQVNAVDNEASERMLEDYDNINLLVRSAIMKITQISCMDN